ncbi:glycine cleavage system protein GcvH [bacterium]|nr:glycine cleavage system protein GcvH [bacterium]
MSVQELMFTKSHEWLRIEGDEAVIGLTDYAQHELGDIVFVELPDEGTTVSVGDVLATVESVKSVSEVYTPATGDVIEVNTALDDSPDLINTDAQGDGWLVKLRIADASEIEGLMSADDYEEHTKG